MKAASSPVSKAWMLLHSVYSKFRYKRIITKFSSLKYVLVKQQIHNFLLNEMLWAGVNVNVENLITLFDHVYLHRVDLIKEGIVLIIIGINQFKINV